MLDNGAEVFGNRTYVWEQVDVPQKEYAVKVGDLQWAQIPPGQRHMILTLGDRKQCITHQTIHNVYHWAEKHLRDNDGKLNGLSVPEASFRAVSKTAAVPEDSRH